MKKAIYGLVLAGCAAMPVWADGYGGLAFGLGESCQDIGQTGLHDGDCGKAGVMFRGYMGNFLTDYLRLEVSLDGFLTPWRLFGISSYDEMNTSALTLGGHALINIPLTRDVHVFAGPGVGASMVYVSWNHESWQDPVTYEDYSRSENDYTFGLNYGWSAGIEFETNEGNAVRIQWQTWNSMDSDVLFDKEFSNNYLFMSLSAKY